MDITTFFRKPTVRQITRGKDSIRLDAEKPETLVERILGMDVEHEYVIVDGAILPEESWWHGKELAPDRRTASEIFYRHQRDVGFPRFPNIAATVREVEHGNLPYLFRQARYDAASQGNQDNFSGWGYKPIIGSDKRRRRVPLDEIGEGRRLFSFAVKTKFDFDFLALDDPEKGEKVKREGGDVLVSMPSREGGAYTFHILHIPTEDNDYKFAIANRLISNHQCHLVRHRSRRRTFINRNEDSEIFFWDQHDVAGWYAVLDYYIHPEKYERDEVQDKQGDKHGNAKGAASKAKKRERNLVPLQMSQIPLPSQKFCDYYDRLLFNTVVDTYNSLGDKPKLYSLCEGEREKMLFWLVRSQSHHETLMCLGSRDGHLYDYPLRLPNGQVFSAGQ